MKVQVLNEGSRPNEIGYHFTDLKGLKAILDSNFMKATNEPLKYGRSITRFLCIFPDNSKLTADEDDIEWLQQYFLDPNEDELDYITNNRLKEKIKEFDIKSKDQIKIEEYEYTPYKELIGKKSWSYTRRPEGTSYRNFSTFGDKTVRIGINIDKLTEKGYKIVPFSWMGQPKSGSHNEFEERIYGKGNKENGTDNFMDFVTEIAFSDKVIMNLHINFSLLEFLFNLNSVITNAENILDRSNSFTAEDLRRGEYKPLAWVHDNIKQAMSLLKNANGKQFSINEISNYISISNSHENLESEILKQYPAIKIVYANSDTGKSLNMSKFYKEQIDRFLTSIKDFRKYSSYNPHMYCNFNDYILTNMSCKKEFDKLESDIKLVVEKSAHWRQLSDTCSKKFNEYRKEGEI